MYCTIEDLKRRLPESVLIELTDDEGSEPAGLDQAGEEIIARLNEAIADATNEINGYCQARYPVPFDPVPGFIRKLAVDIAAYNLFSRRGYSEDSADKSVIDRYRAAVRTLENIARGLISLGAPEPLFSSEVEVRGQTRVFSRQKLEAF